MVEEEKKPEPISVNRHKHYKEINYPTLVPIIGITVTDMFICIGLILFAAYIAAFFIIFVRNLNLGIAAAVSGVVVVLIFFIISKYIYSVDRKIKGVPPKSNVLIRYVLYILKPSIHRSGVP